MDYFRSGNNRTPVVIEKENKQINLKFGFNAVIKDEVKVMEGARWNPEQKAWTVKDTQRNNFAIDFLLGKNVYAPWDAALSPFKPNRGVKPDGVLYDYQCLMASHQIERPGSITAAEMGCGKTLVTIEVLEHFQKIWNDFSCWFVAPKVALLSVRRDYRKWQAKFVPNFFTIHEFVNQVKALDPTKSVPPRVVIFDEASKYKNEAAKCSQAALWLANFIREYWGDKGRVILMSGSPAPKSPLDWWHLCLAKGTNVLTSAGVQPIESVKDNVLVNGIRCNSSGGIKSGEKEVFRVVTDEGYSLSGTCDHLVMTTSGWQKIGQLVSGTKIVLHDHTRSDWSGIGSFNDGYLLGHMTGDGYKGHMLVCGPDIDAVPFLQSLIKGRARGWYGETNGCKTWNLTAVELIKLCEQFGMKEDKTIPIRGLSKDCIRGYLSGLFDTDGYVCKQYAEVGFSQINEKRCTLVQELLLYFGIVSRMYTKAGAVTTILGRTTKNSRSWQVIVTGQHAKQFCRLIGFKYPRKAKLASKCLSVKTQMSRSYEATVKSVISEGTSEVYDISVPGPKAFSANGIYVHNCEIARPGFIREGTLAKFRDRVAVVKKVQGESGVAYPKIITFKDSNKKCEICGRFDSHEIHQLNDLQRMMTSAHKEPENEPHKFIPMTNEVEKLYSRLDGLVQVTLKKNCLQLPEKIYRIIKLPPSKYVKNLARMLLKTAGTSAQALLLLRELSDGFQYQEELIGTRDCPHCVDSKTVFGDSDKPECFHCAGKGVFKEFKVSTVECDTPKVQATIDVLDELDEEGRINIFGAFQGTIDRICTTVVRAGWHFIRRDGRGWFSDLGTSDPDVMLDYFQRIKECPHERIAFIGHPASCGMGLDLTASQTSLYYSNSFNAEDRIQSEDRLHRHGCRGANILDFEHLPVDKLVRENIKKKIDLQSITLGDIGRAFDEASDDELD